VRRLGKVNGGFTLIEVMMVMGIGTVLILVIATIMKNSAVSEMEAMTFAQLATLRRDLFVQAESDVAWVNTVRAGSAAGARPASKMDCLLNGNPCTVDGSPGGVPITDQPFALYDNSNNLVLDGTSATIGLTTQASACNSFSQATGDDQCPFRFDLKWSAVCTPGACTYPLLKISGTLQYKPKSSKLSFNTANYSLSSFYRESVVLTLPPPPPPPCGGTLVGGYCWYTTGYSPVTCTQICSTHGGVNTATRDFAGSNGTDAQCAAVLTSLGFPNDWGIVCGLAMNANGVLPPSPLPCVNACGATSTQQDGCIFESWSGTYNGGARGRCTNQTTSFNTPALEMSGWWGATNDALACACNN
jgi:prepilin-type N-terminal cleavage/methylation domain-containing protein